MIKRFSLMEDFIRVRHYFPLGLQHGRITSFSPPDSYPVVAYLFLQRNMERQFDARKGAWEGGRKSKKCFVFFFRPSLDAPRTHYILTINHSAYREATGYESVSPPSSFPQYMFNKAKFSNRIEFIVTVWNHSHLSMPDFVQEVFTYHAWV